MADPYSQLGTIDRHTLLVAHCAAALVPLVSVTKDPSSGAQYATRVVAKALQAAEEAVTEYEKGRQ